MVTRNKKKLAVLNKENCEEHPWSNLAQNSNVSRSQQDYKTQISEEIEGRVAKKLSQKFSRTENRLLGALARLDDFLTNPLIQGHSGTARETSRNVFSISQGTNEDDSQSNLHPEAGIFDNQMTRWPRIRPLHGDRSSRRSDLLLPYYIFKKAEKTGLQVNHNSAVKTPLRRLRQTRFCGPFSSWQTTTILQNSILKITELPNCCSHLRQKCPHLTGNLKSSICLKISSKRASKFIFS